MMEVASLDPAGSSAADAEVTGSKGEGLEYNAERSKGGSENGEQEKMEEGEATSGRKSRRNSSRKPRTKGLVRKLQEQVC